MRNETNTARKRRVRVIPILLLLFIITTAAILVDSNLRIVTTEYEIGFTNLPTGFDGYRIIVLSDIHAAQYGENNAKLLSMVIEAQPDIIAITGDLIDGNKEPLPEEQLKIAETLALELTRVAPVYYITGNHDWDSGIIRTLLPLLTGCGVDVLRNTYTTLESGGDRIILAGVDDPNGPADMIKPDELIGRIRKGAIDDFIVLLEHRNYNLSRNSELGIDLVISGHAHGGIIRLPFTDGLFGSQRDLFPTYTNGVYSMGGTKALVSRGVGNHTGLPRFLNNSEIVVAILRKT